MKKILNLLLAAMVALPMIADGNLSLRNVMDGTFYPERYYSIVPMNDGEHFARMSNDRKMVLQCSFKSGEVVDTLFECVEGLDRVPNVVEKCRVGLYLLDDFVEQFGHKECDGALAHIEGYGLEWSCQSHLLYAVDLGLGAINGHDVEQKHRLKERTFAPLASSRFSKPLHHIVLPALSVGQQVGNHRRFAIFERVEHYGSGFVLLHKGLIVRGLLFFGGRSAPRAYATLATLGLAGGADVAAVEYEPMVGDG